jgi:translation initiation factor IF-3
VITSSPTKRMSQPRINQQIRIRQVLLIDADGTHRGIVPIEVAHDAARAQGLDLVEIAPMVNPPGVRIMDWTGAHR